MSRSCVWIEPADVCDLPHNRVTFFKCIAECRFFSLKEKEGKFIFLNFIFFFSYNRCSTVELHQGAIHSRSLTFYLSFPVALRHRVLLWSVCREIYAVGLFIYGCQFKWRLICM